MNIWFRRLLVILTVGGGFLGVVVTVTAAFTANKVPWFGYVVLTLVIALYSYGIAIGIKLAEGREPYGHLLLFLALQIPFISSPIFLYRFGCGFQATVAIVGFGLGWIVRLGSEWQLAILQPNAWGFGINLFALAIFFAVFIHSFYGREAPSEAEPPESPKEPPPYDYCSGMNRFGA